MASLYSNMVDRIDNDHDLVALDALNFFRRTIKHTDKRAILPGQVAYVNVTTHRGVTNVPKYGCWVVVTKVFDNHVQCRVIGPRNGVSYTRSLGYAYTCSKSSLNRIDFWKWFTFNPGENNTDLPPLHDDREALAHVRYLVKFYLETANAVALYRSVCNGNAAARLADKLRRGETRHLFRMWSLADAYRGNAAFFLGIKDDLKKLGQRHAERLRMLAMLNPSTDTDLAVQFHRDLATLRPSNRFRFTTQRELSLVDLLKATVFVTFQLRLADSCGHVVAMSTHMPSVYNHRDLCPVCYASRVSSWGEPVTAITREGMETLAFRVDTYDWADGSVRTYDEPPVIGGYHSSKALFTKSLPHITGDMPHRSVLKVGYELEFVRAQSSTKPDNVVARQMKANIAATMAELFPGSTQPYCGFERDGSVDFELVSGYGPMDTHRAVLLNLLADDEWRTHLNSHNGGRCGLHVHLDAPESLLHAVRIQAFYNNPFNEHLLRSVARRYGKGSGYAKIKGDKGDSVRAAKQVANHLRYYGKSKYERTNAISKAIRGLSDERYEAVNFTPATTVEVRIFRGSLVTGTVLACLEFAFLSWYFCRDTTQNQLTTDNFLAFISRQDWRHESRYLRKYLWGKGFKVWMPKKQPRASVVEV